jgi:hypothetical protein
MIAAPTMDQRSNPGRFGAQQITIAIARAAIMRRLIGL